MTRTNHRPGPDDDHTGWLTHEGDMINEPRHAAETAAAPATPELSGEGDLQRREPAPGAPAPDAGRGDGRADGRSGDLSDDRSGDFGGDFGGDSGDDGSGDDMDGDVNEPAGTSGGAVAWAAFKEFAIVVGMALVLSFVVKTWLLQAFYIPSGSMEDTLVLNDRVIVSKLTPGPIDLKRGDIVVFADPGDWLDPAPPQPHGKVATVIRDGLTFIGLLPDNSENHLIKRVIGLPGDHVVCCDEGGRITINGAPIKEPYLKPGDAASEQNFDITVPAGRVWVMGDHRSNSADSRVHDGPANNGSTGSVEESLIVGRAVVLVWPLDHFTVLTNPSATFANVPPPSKSAATPAGAGPPAAAAGGH